MSRIFLSKSSTTSIVKKLAPISSIWLLPSELLASEAAEVVVEEEATFSRLFFLGSREAESALAFLFFGLDGVGGVGIVTGGRLGRGGILLEDNIKINQRIGNHLENLKMIPSIGMRGKVFQTFSSKRTNNSFALGFLDL